MSQEADAIKPDFASSAATLRDTIKWLATAFAATAALIIGNSPVSGLGKLDLFSGRWWLALLLLVAGFALICLALWRSLRILKPDVLYRSSLLGTHDNLLDKEELDELQTLRSDIDAHGADLLPPNYPSLKQLTDNLAVIDQRLKALRATPSSEPDSAKRAKSIQEGMSVRAKHWAVIARLLPLAQYLRLNRRFEDAQFQMTLFSALALASLLAFAIVSTVPDKKDDPTDHVINIQNHCGQACDGQPPVSPPLPVLPAVLFAPDRATLSKEGLAAIELARNALRENPRTLLLLQAHTDTMASRSHNDRLAHQRALVVLGLLTSQGGVAPERLMVSYLPETGLPRVTPDQKPEQANRSVRLVWLEDTRR